MYNIRFLRKERVEHVQTLPDAALYVRNLNSFFIGMDNIREIIVETQGNGNVHIVRVEDNE